MKIMSGVIGRALIITTKLLFVTGTLETDNSVWTKVRLVGLSHRRRCHDALNPLFLFSRDVCAVAGRLSVNL